MQDMIDRIKQQWQRDPMATVVIGSIALSALGKFLSVLSEAEGRHAYAKQVKLQTKRQRRGQ